MPEERILELGAVQETTLWTLYHRAAEARRPDTVLNDPLAVQLVERLDFPFVERFGPAHPLLAQAQALRARRFDLEIARFLRAHPTATVVALGDGLETQFWRVDNGRARWLSVDLADTVDARRRLLPSSSRQRAVACSALDDAWMDEVAPDDDVLITAQGLLMYLQPDQPGDLLVRSARRFAGATMLFDAVPRWFSDRTMKGMRSRTGYQPPPMPWGVDAAEREWLATLPGITELAELHLPRGRGAFFGGLAPLLRWRLPGPLHYLAPWSIFRASFGYG